MANELTGDFDVVAEFAIPATNRLLAAMHRSERFPHSMTLRVDDNPPPGSKGGRPTIVGSVDTFGDIIVDHDRIGMPNPLPGQLTATNPIYSALDQVVNVHLAGVIDGTIEPSRFQGRAQLQLSPPTIEVADGSGTNITVRMQIVSRYFPDPHTSALAEFIRGELRMTAAVNQVASQAANVVDIDIKADKVKIDFNPIWSNRPVTAADVAGINLLIRNAFKTSFLPSNSTLPSDIKYMQFKTLLGAQSTIAVLLNMGVSRGNPASSHNVFLGSGDDFAFAASKNFILGVLNFQLQPVSPFWVYTVSLQNPSVKFETGRIQLTVKGHAHTPKWYLPDLDFTVTQAFTLRLVAGSAGGPLDTAEIALLGDVSFNADGIAGWIVNRFKNRILGPVRAQRDTAINNVQPTVRRMLSTDKNLGAFLKSLLKPAQQKPGVPPQEEIKPTLAYTSFVISPAGIVLHGSLTVADWPLAHVEFEQIPTTGGTGIGATTSDLFSHGPDYSALKTWIPGAAIQRYEWSSEGQTQPFRIEEHRFVLRPAPPEVSDGALARTAIPAFTPLCLTVRGSRLSSSGPVVAQPVSARVCGYNTFPIVNGLNLARSGSIPWVALARSGARGLLEIAGHATAPLNETGAGSPNLIVHFADDKTTGHLKFFTQAMRESGRDNAPTAFLAVLTTDQLAKAPYTQGVVYTEDQDGAWERVFGVKTTRRPMTLIVDPKGNVVWRHDGALDSATLAAALRKFLVTSGPVKRGMLRLALRIGQPPPNFLFEYAPGRELTLRKLAGRPAALVFWKSASKTSIQTVRELQQTAGDAGRSSVVLAINDGDAAELAKRVAAENDLSATLVTDPQRLISFAYGVNLWPTVVYVESSGLVAAIRYGGVAAEQAVAPTTGKSNAAQ